MADLLLNDSAAYFLQGGGCPPCTPQGDVHPRFVTA